MSFFELIHDLLLPLAGALSPIIAGWVAYRLRSISEGVQSTSSLARSNSERLQRLCGEAELPQHAPVPKKSYRRRTTST